MSVHRLFTLMKLQLINQWYKDSTYNFIHIQIGEGLIGADRVFVVKLVLFGLGILWKTNSH